MTDEKKSTAKTRKSAAPKAAGAKPAAGASGEGEATSRAFRKIREGIVFSNKMTKTIVVRVERIVEHPFYPRRIKRANKFHAHDEVGTAKVGDRVRIMETRPMSKTKRWRLLNVVRRASAAPAVPVEAIPGVEQGAAAKGSKR